jgi:hypothetical protein
MKFFYRGGVKKFENFLPPKKHKKKIQNSKYLKKQIKKIVAQKISNGIRF